MDVIEIKTEYIKLDALLKFSGLCMSGGDAKACIADGFVKVNGDVCFERGRKLRPGDYVDFGGERLLVSEAKG